MFTYDDSRLFKLFEDLDPKTRKKALRGGFTRAAGKVKKAAEKNAKGSGLVVSKEVRKGIRRMVYKKHLGFRVTVGTKGKRTNYKPIALWAEGGTKSRYSKTVSAWKIFRKRRGHYTGKMPACEFMRKTRDEVSGSVEEMLKGEIVNNITRVARKHGCKVT